MKMVPDELWTILEPLIPPAPSPAKGGRPRVAERAALAGILCVRRTGGPWGTRRPNRLVASEHRLHERGGKQGGDATGPDPTDRGRKGTKRHLLVDRIGVPLATALILLNYLQRYCHAL